MSKPKRNDPCPCGSGKKFKKCCGPNNVIELNPSLYNRELEQLNSGLLEFALTHFESKLVSHSKAYVDTLLGDCDEDEFHIYVAVVSAWIIFNKPIENEQTIFDLFYASQKNNITRSRTKKIFSSWNNLQPAVYKIMSIDDRALSKITVQDVDTNEVYGLIFDDVSNDSVGNFLIGLLMPYIQTNDFFYAVSEIPKEQEDFICDLLDDLERDGVGLNEVFPEFFAHVINPVKDGDVVAWLDPRHEMVAHLFANHMLEKGFDEKVIESGVLFWNVYCQMNHPSIKKPGSYASALEYFIQQDLIEDQSVTQAQMAQEYGVSAGTVSASYRRLLYGLDDMDVSGLLDRTFYDSNVEPSSVPPANGMDQFNMEKEMRTIEKLLEGKDFESTEEINAYLNQTLQDGELPPIEETPRDMAQNILFEAGYQEGREQKESSETPQESEVYFNGDGHS